MSRNGPTRRQVIHQPTPQYAAVPLQSPPRSNSYQQQQQQYAPPAPQPPQVSGPRPIRSGSANSNRRNSNGRTMSQNGRNTMAMGVATGDVGAGYGPYSYRPEQARESGVYGTNTRFSTTPSSEGSLTRAPTREQAPPPPAPPPVAPTNSVPQYMYEKDPELDDRFHNPDPPGYSDFTLFSWRGWVNASAIFLIILGLLVLFIGYPLIFFETHKTPHFNSFNVGGINGSGQIPVLPNLPSLIDPETPSNVLTRTGSDGKLYDLVFSDEFNTDGRSFYPGDDAFWEAADLYYWPTGDTEWYDPSAITTRDGKLVITMTEQRIHDLNFQSGMLTSWNKFCFTTGYVEVSVSLPGTPSAPGLWPGAWSLGNLGRAGYGATTEGTWPYSYDTCDSGTFPAQQNMDGTPISSNGLSSQLGQRLSACTCPGSDHPGPSVSVGRGVPEIDIIEARIDTSRMQGQVSQSFQCAPYDSGYFWNNASTATTIYDTDLTIFNAYRGGPFQEAVSAETYIEDRFYGGNDFAPYAYEFWSDPKNRDDGYITWYSNGQKTWTITSATVGPNDEAKVSQRLIPEEPMYLILNLAMADNFQPPDFKHLVFPAEMFVDYVRVYQRRGIKNGVGCNPPNYPTTDYINKHMNAYTNPNLTTWASAGQTFPRNSKFNGCT
ncbi:beta-glucan synthesis-associated [Pholiota conissans]|uniref:Beta-glucan synthesis-associated n=1 Tax=Pholiota conissans TaxID=109636 RepID=A0A9P5Z6M6_9AGAR|nr:beta-glucan synthesis-associated [Pholiota conissans]